MKWKDFPASPCPKCGKEDAKVLTRSTIAYKVYDGEEAKCIECGHPGYVSVEDSECADIIWDALSFVDKYGNVEVRALSWKQPFASLMLHGKVETRVWHARYRGWVLICASKTPYSIPKMEAIAGRQNARINETLQCEPKDLPLGQAIAIGYLYSSQPMSNFLTYGAINKRILIEKSCFVQYNEDLWCHSYRDVQPIVPFDWKGSQGWRILSDEVKSKIKFL